MSFFIGFDCTAQGFERSESAAAGAAGRHLVDIGTHSGHRREEDPQADGTLR